MSNDDEPGARGSSNFVELLLWRARHQPDQVAYTYVAEGEPDAPRITYADLDRQARAVAARLPSLGAAGDRALLIYPPGLEFITAFFGCLFAGFVAIPSYPPRPNRSWKHIQAIGRDAQPTVILTTSHVLSTATRGLRQHPDLSAIPWQGTDDISVDAARDWRAREVLPEALAVLQYTSGSTSVPRGVMVSHENLMHNSSVIKSVVEHPSSAHCMSWLPHFHDMGLLAGILQPLFHGCPGTLMSPVAFLQRPLRWLQAISRTRATLSGGPNFCYDLCVRKTTAEERASLDLSTWEVAYNGAEPVHQETIDRFVKAFAPCGFRAEAIFPCYGLAESTLIVSGGPKARRPVVVSLQKDALEQGVVAPDSGSSSSARRVVGCGQIAPTADLVIVDPDSLTECPPERIGEIWVASRSVAGGYWNRPEESTRTFRARLADRPRGPFLRTGDLGFVKDGELFVTGRLKDLLIIMGRNYYPHDIERTVEACHPALRPACGAAFTIDAEEAEQLVIVQEVERGTSRDLEVDQVSRAIRSAVAEHHDLDVSAVVLLKTGSLPKTTSGKVQRNLCRSRFLSGTLSAVGSWRRTRGDQDRRAVTVAGQSGLPAESRGTGQGAHETTKQAITAWLVSHIAERVQVNPRDINVHRPLGHYGLGSFEAVSLAGDLERYLGRRVPATLAWEHPTIDALASHLGGEPASVVSKRGGSAERPSPSEAIAIVGLGCRFPGGPDPDSFWRLLQDGESAIKEVPPDRWSLDRYYDPDRHAPGKMYTRRGGFLERVDLFDAPFFEIMPREAISLDPQQRLLLEVAWEALEYAGEAPQRLRGSRTGVFVGIGSHDYAQLHLLSGVPSLIDTYSGTGSALSIAAGRVSYVMGLQGPSVAIDTSCSSSLVAVHLACQSLRSRESDMALAGGVGLILTPENSIYFCRVGALSPDGVCKSFDAAADGYGRGEGCGVVVLKRLSTALADGNQILAVIRGSAVNQDGRSHGLTVPNGLAQQAVIRDALTNARVEPADVDYVEAHGTGTRLGDPIEVRALGTVLGADRGTGRALAIGSVKANIGHLEAAAGVAGVIKVVLALQHRELPPQPQLRTLNPAVSWAELGVTVLTERTPWPAGERRRIAGISSFGFSGTNAHVVLEEAPAAVQDRGTEDRPVHILALSAKDAQALKDLATRFDGYVQTHPEDSLADVCFTANAGRSHFPHRFAVVGSSPRDMCAGLAAFRTDGETGTVRLGHAHSQEGPRVAFVFTGAADRLEGIGAALYRTEPVFRKALDRCEAAVRTSLTRSLLSILVGADEAPAFMDGSLRRDLALFALEFALTELWTSWGIAPAVVMGCGIGEYAAACAAGVLAPEDALRLLHAHGNGKTLDGSTEAEPLERGAVVATFAPPRLPFVSAMTGEIPRDAELAGAGYWERAVREPEDLSTAIKKLSEQGCEAWVEIGPQPAIMEAARSQGLLTDQCWVASLHRGRDAWTTMLESLAALYVRGVHVDWVGFDRHYPRRRLALPTYPFQRERFWIDHVDPHAPAASGASAPSSSRRRAAHPLLGARVLSPALDAVVFEQELRAAAPAFLADHRVYDAAILPAAAYLEVALAGAGAAFGPGPWEVDRIQITRAMVLADAEPRLVQTIFRRVDAAQVTFQVVSLGPDDDPEPASWSQHAAGRLRIGAPSHERSWPEPISVATLRARCGTEVSGRDFYRALHAHGLSYGPRFQGVERVWKGKGEALGRISLPDVLRAEAESYLFHPALLDACLHVVAATRPDVDGGEAYVPVDFGRLRIHRKPGPACYCRAIRQTTPERAQDVVKADLFLIDGDGAVLVELADLVCKRVSRAALFGGTGRDLMECLYRIDWRSQESGYMEAQREPGRWIILADRSGLADALAARFAEYDQTCHRVARAREYRASESGDYTLDPSQPPHFHQLFQDVLQRDPTPCRGVVHFWALDAAPPDDTTVDSLRADAAAICGSALHLVQGLAQARFPESPRLYFVTRGAHALGVDSATVSVAQASLGGLAAAIGAEHPDLHCLTVDLDPCGGSGHDLEALVEELLTPSQENQVGFRRQRRLVPRLVRRRLERPPSPVSLREEATYLITGGTGALGLLVARWMVERGARHLVLVGRRGALQAAGATLEDLERAGARIVLMAADISQEDDLSRVATQLSALPHALRGIVHAAGIVDDGILVRQDWARMASVLAPKVLGAWNLHALSEGHPLDFFVLFSSAAAWFPSEGQGSYSAGNAFLDALAQFRKARGLPALSVNWGPWAGTGMAGRVGQPQWQRWRAWGISQIDRREGLGVLECLLQAGSIHGDVLRDAQIGVLPIEWETFIRHLPEGREPSLLVEIAGQLRSQLKEEQLATKRQVLLTQLSKASGAEQEKILERFVQDQVVQILGFDSSAQIDPSKGFIEIGMDSMMAVELQHRIQLGLGIALPATAGFDYPDIKALATYLCEKLAARGAAAT